MRFSKTSPTKEGLSKNAVPDICPFCKQWYDVKHMAWIDTPGAYPVHCCQSCENRIKKERDRADEIKSLQDEIHDAMKTIIKNEKRLKTLKNKDNVKI